MLGIAKIISDKITRRNRFRRCERCGLFFEKNQPHCPHCHDIDDATLKRLLNQRADTRMSLGRWMFVAAIAVLLIMFLLAGF